jgi:tetratricopeptide (TPR) repeat protein
MAYLDTAVSLDPRNDNYLSDRGLAQLYAHKYDDARASLDRSLTFNPTNLTAVEWRMLVSLADGDVAGAQAVIRTALSHVDTASVVAYIASVRDLGWTLDAGEQRVLRQLTPAAFDNDHGLWGLALAESYAADHDQARARDYADSAVNAYRALIATTPGDAELHAHYGVSLALLGRPSDAIREGEQAAALLPVRTDARDGIYIQHQLARIYILTGNIEKARAVLEPLLQSPGYLSARWIAIDPDFAALNR